MYPPRSSPFRPPLLSSGALCLFIFVGPLSGCRERPDFSNSRTENQGAGKSAPMSGATDAAVASAPNRLNPKVDGGEGSDGSTRTDDNCDPDEYLDGNGAESRCRPVTQCPPGKSISIEATKTSDRICSVCGIGRFMRDGACAVYTECADDEFESGAPTETEDRECQALTRCVEGQYVSKQATEKTDRACRSCKDGEFSAAVNADACAPFSQCVEGEIEKDAPTKSRDRVCGECEGDTFVFEGSCKPYTVCESDEYEATPPAKSTDRSCANLTVCAQDEYEVVAATENSDRVCARITTCVAGQYVDVEASKTRDRDCASCLSGTFSSVSNADACVAWTECVLGELESVKPSAERDRVCSGCPDGSYEFEGHCVNLTVCGEEQYESSPPTADSDRSCGTLTVCRSGEYESVPSTSVSDRECQPWRSCVAGQYVATEPTETNDRMCSPCPPSTFSGSHNAVACAPWSECEEGWHEFVQPTSSNDRTCTACEPGTRQCAQGKQQLCSTVGDWVDNQTCTFVCSSGACSGECVPGERRCGDVATPQSCNSSGMWINESGCGASSECIGAGVCKNVDGIDCTSSAQCVSDECTIFYRDEDGDGFGGDPRSICGTTAPADHVSEPGDCCDIDDKAKPTNNTNYPDANACGNFDYDCDGEATLSATAVHTGCTGHQGPCSGTEGSPGWSGGIPACGESGIHVECATQGAGTTSGCGPLNSTWKQTCR
jgi:hypothetical protein